MQKLFRATYNTGITKYIYFNANILLLSSNNYSIKSGPTNTVLTNTV